MLVGEWSYHVFRLEMRLIHNFQLVIKPNLCIHSDEEDDREMENTMAEQLLNSLIIHKENTKEINT